MSENKSTDVEKNPIKRILKMLLDSSFKAMDAV